MKLITIAVAAAAGLMTIASCKTQNTKVGSDDLKTLEQKASYALGSDMARNITLQIRQYATRFSDLDSNLIKAAFVEYLNTGVSQLDSATIKTTLEEFGKIAMEKKKSADSTAALANIEAGKKYIADQMAANPKFVKTASGLVYEVVKEGNGPKPTADNTVSANYKGMLIDGTVFDESKGQPVSFNLKSVVQGWTEGLQLMSVGSKYKFLIPAELAYGNQERPPHIKPGSTLVFEVELVGIK